MQKCCLVVEDEDLQALAFARNLQRRGWRVSVARNVREADVLVATDIAWDAAFVDLRLPDGTGLDVLSRLRAMHERTRVLLMTGAISPDQINAALDLGAEILMKPISWERIDRFLLGARPLLERLEERARAWADQYGLSPTETEILVSVAAGARRAELAAARHVSPLTIKTHVTHMLDKLGDESLQDAAHRLLLEVAQALCD